MQVPSHSSPDPHWDRVVEIASKLWINGEYVVELHRPETQRLVDLQWAAHQAGRVLGGRAKVETSSSRTPEDPITRLTVTYVDSDGRGLKRAEEGLENLLRHVIADQLRHDR